MLDGTMLEENAGYCVIQPLEDDIEYLFEISNIGHGMALKIESIGMTDEHNEAFFTGLTTKDVAYFRRGICSELAGVTMSFVFFDIFNNKYKQSFECQTHDAGGITIVGGSIPEMIERTDRIRYVQ